MDTLKQLRLQENLTLKEMAIKLGISESLYQKLEYGIRKPSLSVIKKVRSQYPKIDINIFFN